MHGGITDVIEATGQRHGRIDLAFARSPENRTFLRKQFASYPFHICRPHLYPGDPQGMATLYLQCVCGGIFEGDRLATRIVGERDTALHVTSQASTIVHSMERDHAEHAVTIEAEEGSLVEYIPDTTILFPRANLRAQMRLQAHETATIIVSDAFLSHAPTGCSGSFTSLSSDTVATDASGHILARDKFDITGDLLTRALPGLNGPWLAQGTVTVLHRHTPVDALLDRVRLELDGLRDTYAGASLLPSGAGILSRLLCRDGHALRTAVVAVWSAAREHITALRPTVRRK